MSANQFRDCRKFKVGDVVEYRATSPEFKYLNGSVELIIGSPTCRINPATYNFNECYAYPIAWVVVAQRKNNHSQLSLSGLLCNEDRLRRMKCAV